MMQFRKIEPPRKFKVGGSDAPIQLSHVMDIDLGPDEQVTFTAKNGGEFDVCRKSWGYYATPSINDRLIRFGYRTCLVKSGDKHYIHLVEKDKIDEYLEYLIIQNMKVIQWLDEDTPEPNDNEKVKQ